MQTILLSFVVIIGAGILWRRVGPSEMPADPLRQAINAAVFNLFLPALCLQILYRAPLTVQSLLVPLTAWITLSASLALAWGVYRLIGKRLGLQPGQIGALILAATFGNVTYLGLPVLTELFGPGASQYAIFYDLLASTPFLWLAGVALAGYYGTGDGFRLLPALRTLAMLPPIWGCALGLAANALHLPLPDFVLKAATLLGSAVIPLMIFTIGLALKWPRAHDALAAAPAVVIKLAIVPLISVGVAYLLGLRHVPLASCLIEGAMPTMVLALLIAHRFDLDSELAALCILISTGLAFLSLPVAVWALTAVSVL